ncbi:MAG: hypothetical protein EXR72_26670 [Myxococcales bacterium]|nr:hypothetical protein [Myxococcales bacterium]
MTSLRAIACAALCCIAACVPKPPPVTAADPALDGEWRTMRAEHRVTIDAAKPGGREQRTLRGVIAVARPDRFRLRALGPGGITLFDLLYLAGEVKVVQSLRDPAQGTVLGEILRSMVGDLAAAYGLAPAPPERAARVEGGTRIVVEPGREVRLSNFRAIGGKAAAERIAIDNRARDYRVTVEVTGATLDEPLDPELFRAP